jgi:dihydroneopterin aldolase
MDKIYIEALEVFSLIGVYDWERQQPQRLLVDIQLYADLSQAAQTDKVQDTLNYAQVAEYIRRFCHNNEYQLIEALASRLMDALLVEFPILQKIQLKLSKPDILANAKNVAVEFSKGRKT